MSQNVLLLANEVMEKMKQYYHKSLTTTPQGLFFVQKLPMW